MTGVVSKLKFLVVDDKKVIGDMFDFILKHSGHDIVVCQDPDSALETAKKERFDLAFLDIIMPQGDGIELLEKLRQIAPRLPVVMMSGFTVDEKRQRAKELGVDVCLKKPFDFDEVRKAVKLVIGKDI
jgi:DNA-binding response OmpR family regulator